VLTIRPADNNDIPLIRKLTYLVWPQTYREILTDEQIDYMLEMMYSPASLQKQMEEESHFIIISQDNKPVGFASYQLINKLTGKLHKIYVVPTGQKTGAGRSMLHYVMKSLKEMGAKAIQLQVNRNNNARFFYEKEGFKVIEEADFDIGNGYYMNDFVMERKL
jgi:ribosomal protein S18 acetylase RimI-like enzyme